MLQVTVIKSQSKCYTCGETEMIIAQIAKNYQGKVEFRVIIDGSDEAKKFGMVTTPVVAIGNKIYAMGKPVIKEKVENWIKKELGESTANDSRHS